MKVGPKYKICKRLGGEVFEKCQTQKFQLAEARSKKGSRGFKKVSDYGKQLLEKQKVRFSYGLTEKQFRKYVDMAVGTPDAVAALNAALEMRLDNVLYRSGLAVTRRQARQLVGHGHVVVGDRKIKIPSHRVAVGDSVAIREGSKGKTIFTTAAAKEADKTPQWLVADRKKLAVTIKETPAYERTVFDFPAVFEFYSR